ncbi:unnamed protein product [Heligmosomoides polygyrus]|uniref:NR LBD domain-containing protein n=1 Tax=Heligmosomoides polygyrus TaxID=6339 RepID=A0A183F9I9_HELPZ|nr:unnamed protein product [Heligmosomoides polygyrus]
MSADLVLNEDERVQKRELIKGNRERRHLEQLLGVIKGSPLDEASHKEIIFEIDLITNSYCRNIDQAMTQSARSSERESDGQLTEILRLIVRRSSDFARVVGVWNTLPLECQTQLLHSTMLEVHLLRFASFFDETEDSFKPAANVSLSHSDLLETLTVDVVDQDEMDELRELLNCLFSLARSLVELQLDDRLLAVLSAMFIFDPSNVLDPSMVSILRFRKI